MIGTPQLPGRGATHSGKRREAGEMGSAQIELVAGALVTMAKGTKVKIGVRLCLSQKFQLPLSFL